MTQRQSVTSIEVSPEQERKSRFLKYTIAMIVRVICIVLAVLLPLGWFTVIFGIGAIFLPYFAVIVANTASANQTDKNAKAHAPTLSISADAFRAKDSNES
jgi:predicted tellurium resistance membrane protein TerC